MGGKISSRVRLRNATALPRTRQKRMWRLGSRHCRKRRERRGANAFRRDRTFSASAPEIVYLGNTIVYLGNTNAPASADPRDRRLERRGDQACHHANSAKPPLALNPHLLRTERLQPKLAQTYICGVRARQTVGAFAP